MLVVFAFGVGCALKARDFLQPSNDLDSTWLFLKWVFIDFCGLFVLPMLRIPWLELGYSTTVTFFLLSAVLDGIMMFHIPIPIGLWLSWLVKLVYDRELSVSERRVNPSEIIHNASLILGKQIIHILPEGAAVLNPDRLPLCLDSTVTSVDLPIRINQTTPILIELLRVDPETQETELISINARQAKQLKRQAEKHLGKKDVASPRTLHLSVKKPGIYQLQRVIDESKLEVQKRAYDTIVPNCPQANIVTDSTDKCTKDTSNLAIKVSGLPPFDVKYTKTIGNHQTSAHFQNVQPEDLMSPLNMKQPSNALVDPHNPQLDWAKAAEVSVYVDEVLANTGLYSYTIDQVTDASGNTVSYRTETVGSKSSRRLGADQQQDILVHRRPTISVTGCDPQHPLKAPEGRQIKLPIDMSHLRHLPNEDIPLSIEYGFMPETDEGASVLTTHNISVSKSKPVPMIKSPGFYTLRAVQSKYCSGTIVEPASCSLINPPRPDLAMHSEDVADVCAGNPIGLRVDLDLTGTPPFQVRYTVLHNGHLEPKVAKFDSPRGHLDLIPFRAGSYVYEFTELVDDVYGPVSLKQKGLILNQNVKPAASAVFTKRYTHHKLCLGSRATAEVSLVGDAPWNLEYEVVHQGKRERQSITTEESMVELTTKSFTQGGQYSIILTSITDKTGCKRSLNEEVKVEVRTDQARAKFADVSGKYSIVALEGRSVEVPVRLQGIGPWKVTLSKGDPNAVGGTYNLKESNSWITVREPGQYRILGVDDTCPGVVDETANNFEVSWIDRPSAEIRDSNVSSKSWNIFQKEPVCEGDEDQVRLSLKGNAPFVVFYTVQQKPDKGSGYVHHKELAAGTGSATIHVDTSKAGEISHTVYSLSDKLYAHEKGKFQNIAVHQKINPLPSAQFASSGKTYSYCTNEASGSEVIPIHFSGTPPFHAEIGITQHGSARPETVKFKSYDYKYDWSLSREGLDLGTHAVSIRKVSDSNGCERVLDTDPSSVRIMVSDIPSINPLESTEDYCVGEHISFSLSGLPPFEIFYRFQNHDRKAVVASSSNPTFRRIAEQSGDFTITALSDNASGKCRAEKNITKHIHPMPTVKISKGRTSVVDIHEGGEAELLFEFTGTPPFEFTYTRSETPKGKKGSRPVVLETRSDKSDAFQKRVRASDAGVYEVTSIKDRYCSFSLEKGGQRGRTTDQKLLTN